MKFKENIREVVLKLKLDQGSETLWAVDYVVILDKLDSQFSEGEYADTWSKLGIKTISLCNIHFYPRAKAKIDGLLKWAEPSQLPDNRDSRRLSTAYTVDLFENNEEADKAELRLLTKSD